MPSFNQKLKIFKLFCLYVIFFTPLRDKVINKVKRVAYNYKKCPTCRIFTFILRNKNLAV